MKTAEVKTQKDLESWLDKNHKKTDSVWLVYYKKNSQIGDLDWSKIVDSLLCYGWIDSVPGKVDEQRTKIRISPRNPKSNWSRVNKEKVEKLYLQKRIKEAGNLIIEIAKSNGSWDALNNVENLIIPPDMKTQLSETNMLKWEKLARYKKRGFLEKLLNSKKIATRNKNIIRFIKENLS